MPVEVRRVVDIVTAFNNEELRVPSYQREYCWSGSKPKHFLERTITLGHVLGVITVYGLKGVNVEYLQDGLQRITTLSKAIANPDLYELCEDDVISLKKASVSYQSVTYDSHDVARQDFQYLNDGIGLVPYEKYRGDLERDNDGKKLYEDVREKTRNLVLKVSGESQASKRGRKLSGQLHRNALGLFYQCVSGHTENQIYAISERCLGNQIERRVRSWLDENILTWQQSVTDYIRALERVNALLETATKSYPAKRWDSAVIRGFYAAYFYNRNTNSTIDKFRDLIEWYVRQNESRKKWNSRFDVFYEDKQNPFRIDQVNLKWLSRVQKLGGPALEPFRRVKKILVPAGYNESHLMPHADGGEITFPEPAMLNLARGREPVSEKDLAFSSTGEAIC